MCCLNLQIKGSFVAVLSRNKSAAQYHQLLQLQLTSNKLLPSTSKWPGPANWLWNACAGFPSEAKPCFSLFNNKEISTCLVLHTVNSSRPNDFENSRISMPPLQYWVSFVLKYLGCNVLEKNLWNFPIQGRNLSLVAKALESDY